MPINNIPKCNAKVTHVRELADTPSAEPAKLKEAFDLGGEEIKEYLNDHLVLALENNFSAVTAEKNSSFNELNNKIDANKTETEKTIPHVYVNSSADTKPSVGPQIRFVKGSAPNTGNYGASLPSGSIVFVY